MTTLILIAPILTRMDHHEVESHQILCPFLDIKVVHPPQDAYMKNIMTYICSSQLHNENIPRLYNVLFHL